jgi:hypothetical protein
MFPLTENFRPKDEKMRKPFSGNHFLAFSATYQFKGGKQ